MAFASIISDSIIKSFDDLKDFDEYYCTKCDKPVQIEIDNCLVECTFKNRFVSSGRIVTFSCHGEFIEYSFNQGKELVNVRRWSEK